MIKQLALSGLVLVLAACGTTQPLSVDEAAKIKQFAAPSAGKAGVYVYRERHAFKGTSVVSAVFLTGGETGGEKDIWIDGECLGATSFNTVLYTEVDGNKNHTITSESGNTLNIKMDAGKNYFIKQEPTAGVITNGYRLLAVNADQAKPKISKFKLIQTGNCSKPNPK